jgi:hypothetical protein
MAEHMGNMADDILPSPQRSGAVVPSIRVFDVNETLLDTACRDLHGGGACVGYDRSAKHRLLSSPHH